MSQSLTPEETRRWIPTLNPLLTKLGTDLHNHRKLADPWQRKAESMAKAWKVLLRDGRPLRPRRTNRPMANWKRAAAQMTVTLRCRNYQQRTRTAWRRWASDRAIQARQWPGKFQSAE